MANSVFLGWIGGVPITWNGTVVTFGGTIQASDGTATVPAYSFGSSGNTDTGIYLPSTGTLGVTIDGVAYVRVSADVLQVKSTSTIGWSSGAVTAAGDLFLSRDAANVLALKNSTNLQAFRVYTASGTGYTEYSGNGIVRYADIATAGAGVPPIFAYGNTVGATGVTASIATYTPAADGTFEVSANCLVTTSTTHSFSLDVTYTDEGNSARTMILPIYSVAGTPVLNALIAASATVPYHSATLTIRAKAATAITVRTSAGGTYTTVTYNARGIIKQVG